MKKPKCPTFIDTDSMINIGNRGVVSVQSFFRMTPTVQELDLSKN
jgi:hypothetical protein